MKRLIFFYLGLGSLLYASGYESYLHFLQNFTPHLGSFKEGEIEIVTDPKGIAEVEEIMKNRLIGLGYSKDDAHHYSRVGIITEDHYWLWIRDAVIFPTGHKGTYNRILWRTQLTGTPAVMVLPTFPDGRIGLVLNYRHATRNWHVQFPFGLRRKDESAAQAASRELKEEIGFEVDQVQHIIDFTPDNGVCATTMPLFRGMIRKTGRSAHDLTEAVEKMVILSKAELLEGLKNGHLTVTIKGKSRSVACDDPALFYATLPE